MKVIKFLKHVCWYCLFNLKEHLRSSTVSNYSENKQICLLNICSLQERCHTWNDVFVHVSCTIKMLVKSPTVIQHLCVFITCLRYYRADIYSSLSFHSAITHEDVFRTNGVLFSRAHTSPSNTKQLLMKNEHLSSVAFAFKYIKEIQINSPLDGLG